MLGAVVILAVSLSASANVTQVVYNLSLPEGDQGITHTYGSDPYKLPIYGFQTNIAAPHTVGDTWTPGGTTTELYGKVTNGNSSETGLGLDKDPDSGQHEIWDDNRAMGVDKFGFVVLDTFNLQQNPTFYISTSRSVAHNSTSGSRSLPALAFPALPAA